MKEAIKTRPVRESDVHKLRPDDKLILDIVAGSRTSSHTVSGLVGYLRAFGLNHGDTYTFAEKESAYKPGEGTHQGWYLHVKEERSRVRVPFEYFAVTEDLEAKLQERRV